MGGRMAGSELGRRVKLLLSALMLVTGLSFYWAYGYVYGEWNLFAPGNDGVYSVVMFFVGMGVVGLLLFGRKATEN